MLSANSVTNILIIEENKNPSLFFSYLHISGDTFGRPISGQREVSGYPSPSELNYWQVMEGIYVTPSEDPLGAFKSDQSRYEHDEF